MIRKGFDKKGNKIYFDAKTGCKYNPVRIKPKRQSFIPDGIIGRFIKPMYQQVWEGEARKNILGGGVSV